MAQELEFPRPCCSSVRTCIDTFDAIISLRNRKLLRRIDAVRCNRIGIVPKYRFSPSPDVALISFYRSSRGNIHIRILWKPNGISEEEVRKIALEALGIIEEETVTW